MTNNQFIRDITTKLSEDLNVSHVFLVGSFARGDYKPTSDIDLIIVCDQSSQYLSSSGFFHQFGIVMEMSYEDYGACKSIRVFYEDGPEIEFGFVKPSWIKTPLDAGTKAVLLDGYVILFDRYTDSQTLVEEFDKK